MKASELFTSLLADAPAAESASKEAAPRVAAFDAALAAAVEQDGEAQDGAQKSAPVELSRSASGREATRERALVLPEAARSIHGITQGASGRTIASGLTVQPSLLEPQTVGDAADQHAVRSSSAGESAKLQGASALSRADDESEEAALRAVLGHVAAAIASIVAPAGDAARAEAAAVDVAMPNSSTHEPSRASVAVEADSQVSSGLADGFAVEVRRAHAGSQLESLNTAQGEVVSHGAQGGSRAEEIRGAEGVASADASSAGALTAASSEMRAARASEQGDRTVNGAGREQPGAPSSLGDRSTRGLDGRAARSAELASFTRSPAALGATATTSAVHAEGAAMTTAAVGAQSPSGAVASAANATSASAATSGAGATSTAVTSAAGEGHGAPMLAEPSATAQRGARPAGGQLTRAAYDRTFANGEGVGSLQTAQQTPTNNVVRVDGSSAASELAAAPTPANSKSGLGGVQTLGVSPGRAALATGAEPAAQSASTTGQTVQSNEGRQRRAEPGGAKAQLLGGAMQSQGAESAQESLAPARSAGEAAQAVEATGRGNDAAAQPRESGDGQRSEPTQVAAPQVTPGVESVNALQPVQQATVLGASSQAQTGSRDSSDAAKPQGKSAADPMARVEGFSRGARFGVAMSAYGGRGHDSGDSMARGKRSDEREHEAPLERPAAEAVAPVIDQTPLVQLQPAAREQPQLELAPRLPAVPMVEPPPDLPEFEFARAQMGQPQGASISLHHPDLGPIQIQVQRTFDRVEVSAVIESSHAEAVLRANESGIRLGVQQSGMSFGALRVKVRGEERVREPGRPMQVRRRRASEREI